MQSPKELISDIDMDIYLQADEQPHTDFEPIDENTVMKMMGEMYEGAIQRVSKVYEDREVEKVQIDGEENGPMNDSYSNSSTSQPTHQSQILNQIASLPPPSTDATNTDFSSDP